MPPVIITGSLNIRIVWTQAAAPLAFNVVNANIGGAAVVNQAMANTIAGFLDAAHTSSALETLQPTSVSLDRVEIRDVRQANQALIPASIASPGTSVGELLPRGVALGVTARTALAGRSFRGRNFIPGFDEASADVNGRATQAAADAAVAFMTDFNSDMSTQGWPLGVGSLFSGGLRRDPGIITNITLFESRNLVWERIWNRALI